MKRKLAELPYVSQENFKNNIEKCMAEIKPEVCHSLTQSINKRLWKTIQSEGKVTKY
jgi:hypothetical protein